MSEYEGEYEDIGEDEDDDEPPPPTPEEDKELLFLIEFLVDTLRLRKNVFLGKHLDPCALKGQNCITLTFLHFPPMSICEMDIDSDKNVGEDETVFNAGKSLVFALTESQFEDPPSVFLEVTAHKEMPHGYPIPRLTLGVTKVDLSELFKMVFDKYDEKSDEIPVSKSIKENFEMIADGKKTADVDIYIRLTCLGQNIVTEFQKSDGICEPFLFKNLESEKVYECKQTMMKEDFVPAGIQGTGRKDCKFPDSSGTDPDDDNFEQIYAEINGSALTVNIEKNKRKEKPKMFKVDDFCDCEFPLPPDLVEGISELSITPVKFDGEQEIPDGGIGKCNNKIVFQVPPVSQLAQPEGYSNMKYSINTCTEGAKHGHTGEASYKIVKGKDIIRPTLPNDPEKDVFVLKILKKGRSVGGRGIVELEFKIPKEKIEPPPKPPYMIERGIGPEKQKDKKKKRKG